MRRVFSLIRKELFSILRDPKIRIGLLLPPILQLFLFTFAATLEVKHIPLGIWNQDVGLHAHHLIDRFQGSSFFTSIKYLQYSKEISSFLEQQKGILVLAIGPSFSKDLEANKKAEIALFLDGRKINSAQIVCGYALRILEQFAQSFSSDPISIALCSRVWFNPNSAYCWYNIPNLVAILSMLACLVVTTQSMLKKKK